MLDNLKMQVVSNLCRIQVRLKSKEEIEKEQQEREAIYQEQQRKADEAALEVKMREEAKAFAGMHIGRNDPCPCGSGKKYKNCHGRFI